MPISSITVKSTNKFLGLGGEGVNTANLNNNNNNNKNFEYNI